MKHLLLCTLLLGALPSLCIHAQDINDYKTFDFVPGEKILLDDDLVADKAGGAPLNWKIEGGKAIVGQEGNDKFINILEYYTKLTPALKSASPLPTSFTIEYDTWLDHGYDGNPGIEIHLVKGEQEIVITPNKHDLVVSFPGDGRASKDNPEAYFGENKFYDRWVHISISYANKQLKVYLDQYKQIVIDDVRLVPEKLSVTGNTSENMKILLRNFKLAKDIPGALQLTNGKFITHAIRFDVNKATVRPESMSVINQVAAYLKANASVKFEIGGHTDSDGDDAANLALSNARANAVKTVLTGLGIPETQLTAKGYGETKPIDSNTTPEGKAANRRVEFLKL